MLTVGEVSFAVIIVSGLYKGVRRKVSVTGIILEIRVLEKLSLMQHEVSVGDQDRSAGGVDAIVKRRIRSKALKDRLEHKRRGDRVLVDRASGTRSMHKHAV